MEFFAQTQSDCEIGVLQNLLTIPELPRLCTAIDKVLQHDGDSGKIYCLWGEFSVHREVIRNGARFTLPGCPNALAWSVTREEIDGTNSVLIHCTINQRSHEPDFIESIEYFVDAWQQGMEQALALKSA
jgi:hypothetical protein